MIVALYARVSTDKQNTDNQMLRLREVASARSYEVYDEYVDVSSGANEAGVNVRQKVMFYVYTDGDDQYDDAVARCRALKEQGTTAYIMLNQETEHTRRLKDLQRWSCRPWIFWSTDIDEYRRSQE